MLVKDTHEADFGETETDFAQNRNGFWAHQKRIFDGWKRGKM